MNNDVMNGVNARWNFLILIWSLCIHVTIECVFCFSKYQQRLPYDLLSSLANVLLDGTVFEIVSSLREVQQLEERNLSNQRIKLINEHKCQLVFLL